MTGTSVGKGTGKEMVITIPKSLGISEVDAKKYADEFKANLIKTKRLDETAAVILIWI